MRLTDLLRRKIRKSIRVVYQGSDQVIIGTDVKYQAQRMGLEEGGTKMPPRPFLRDGKKNES